MLTAASLPSGRFASARSASSCSPAGVDARVITVHLRRKNRTRRYNQGPATARIGVAATAIASTQASQPAVWCRFCPAPARSRAAWLAAVSGLASWSPISGTPSTLSPAELRFSAMPLAPPSTWVPTSAMVDTAECTAIPTITQTTTQPITVTSLTSCMNNRCGREA